MPGLHREGHRMLLTDHVFDKVRSIDMALSEFEVLLEGREIIEWIPIEVGVKELILIVEWTRPLHVVVVVDDMRLEERIVTVYEPDRDRWSPDLRVRKR